MADLPSHNHALLAEIFWILYGKRDLTEAERRIFFNELCRFQKTLKVGDLRFVSRPAIRGWIFKNPPSTPKRRSPMAFLLGFLKWFDAQNPITELEQLKAFSTLIRYLDATVGPEVAPPLPSLNLMDKDHFRETKEAVILPLWNSNNDITNRFLSIEGRYQLIRPYTCHDDKFVLEPIELEIHKTTTEINIIMYSHNAMHKTYMYSGNAFISGKYMFSLARRRDDEAGNGAVFRSIIIYISSDRNDSSYVMHPCFSGIMLRGVKGDAIALTATAMPFILLRAMSDGYSLRSPNFTKFMGGLQRINPNSYILSGIVHKNEENTYAIFKFCKQIFTSLKPLTFKKLNITTIKPSAVAKILSVYTSTNDDYFIHWSNIIDKICDPAPETK